MGKKKQREFVVLVPEIAKRLRDPSIRFTQEDRGKLADLIENLLAKWQKARGENDTIVFCGMERTVTR